MIDRPPTRRRAAAPRAPTIVRAALAWSSLALGGCASGPAAVSPPSAPGLAAAAAATAPNPDPRSTLAAGLFDAGEAIWNLRMLSTTPPPEDFLGGINSDLAFTGRYAVQGSFNGIQIWDISNPSRPSVVTRYVCPASQSDVSVYGDLLFVSGEGFEGLLETLGAIAGERMAPGASALLTRSRHRAALGATLESLDRFQRAQHGELALLAEDLRLAARALGRITGRVGVDDILDRIFADFCIGK